MNNYIIVAKNDCKRIEYMLQSLNKLMIRQEIKDFNKFFFGTDTTVQVRIKETSIQFN